MDKRLYKREDVNLESVFYFELDGKQVEFVGQIVNICEGGIAIAVTDDIGKELVNQLDLGNKLDFVSYDEYELFGKSISAVVSNQVMVVRKDVVDSSTIIGCEVIALNKDFEQYVQNIKINKFMKTCRK